MKLNTDKCRFACFWNKAWTQLNSWAKLDDDKIWERNKVKLLGVTHDNEFKLDCHVANICFNDNQKLSARSR